MADRKETVHEYSRDHIEHLTADALEVAEASNGDQTIVRIERTCKVRGMIETVTRFSVVKSRAVRDHVELERPQVQGPRNHVAWP